MRRVKVLRALILALALFALVVPMSMALDCDGDGEEDDPGRYPPTDCVANVFLRGYVVDECNRGLVGAVVEVWRDAHNTLQGSSEVVAQNGEWGVSLSPIPGDYTIKVILPSGNVTEWRFGYGDKEKKVADAVTEIAWVMTDALADEAKALEGPCTCEKEDDFIVHGPLTIQTDVPCTIPPVGPTFFWGRTFRGFDLVSETATAEGDCEVALLFKAVYYDWDPWKPGQPKKDKVQKWDWVLKAGPKYSRTGDGLYGFGGNPVPGWYMVYATAQDGNEGYTMFFVPEGQFGVTSYGPINVFIAP